MSNIIQTEQILFRNENVYTKSVHVTVIDENRGHEADREQGGCRRRKGKSEMIHYHLKSKIRTKMQ